MDALEHAREGLEHGHGHGHGHGPAGGFARRAAVLIAALAAALAVAEIGAQSAQTEYVARNVQTGDDWTFYGFKETRARSAEQTVVLLQLLLGAPDQPRQDAIAAARATMERMREGDPSGPGTRRIGEQARHRETERDHALHRYHSYEYASAALQIAIVLASAAVATQIAPLL